MLREPRAGGLRTGRYVGVRMTQQDISGCATKEELASLFDNAFATWHSGGPEPTGHRETPRIPGGEVKPLFVVSYTYNGREVWLNRRAKIADISADGLGVALEEPLPVGASLRFAFDSQNGERSSGVATVVRLTRTEGGYRIGLTFTENAKSLDVDPFPDRVETHSVSTAGWRRLFDQFREAVTARYRVLTQRRFACWRAERCVDGQQALFFVEAKLFRYVAALFVDGKKIVSQSGVLRHRLRNFLYDMAIPTMISLEGGGFSAWATLRPNTVTHCTLDLSLQAKHQMCSRVLQGTPALSEPSSPNDVAGDGSAEPLEPSTPQAAE